jgi:hypothetical protein
VAAVAVVARGLCEVLAQPPPTKHSAKFVTSGTFALILDEAVAESCSAYSIEPHPSKPSLPSAVLVSPRTKRCVHARLDRARHLRFHGHLEAALKDFKACKDLLPEEFQLIEKSPESREFQSLSTAIAMQREGRQLHTEANELAKGPKQDRSRALMLYQQSIRQLKTAAHYLVTLRSPKNDGNAKSLTDLAELAEKRMKAIEGD